MTTAATATAEKMPNQVTVLREQLDNMSGQFAAALPAHIPAERFCRVLMTAIQQNPELLECERRSLWNAAMKAAQDGLLADGREGAMVVRKDRNRGKLAHWQPMIAGIRKKARNSGEIATWDAHVVCEGDHFQFQLGDAPQINHAYDLRTERGAIVGAYSVCVLKDGTKSYEVMSIGEIHSIRDRSDAWRAFKAGYIKSTPWSTDEGEMCRKTVARRHSKVIPTSTDLDDLIRRDDALYDLEGAREEAARDRPKSLAGKLDVLAQLPARAAPETAGNGDAAADTGDAADERHDPETGELTETDDKALPQATDPPEGTAGAAGQPASGNTEGCLPIGPGAGEAGKKTKASEKKPAEAKPEDLEPETAAQYQAFAEDWIEKATDPDAALARWKTEKKYRNSLNVEPEVRDALEAKLKAKNTQLRSA